MPHVEGSSTQNGAHHGSKRVQLDDMLMRIMADSQLNPHGG